MKKLVTWILVSVAVIVISLNSGASTIQWSEIGQEGISHTVFWSIRLPRVLLGFLAGGGLALAGLCFQTLFANPLASPYTLGVSSGASFGAVFVLFFAQIPGSLVQIPLPLGAFLGACLCIAILWQAAQRGLAHQTYAMLLAGIALTFFFSSLILLLQAFSSQLQVYHIMRWLMGGLSVVGYGSIGWLALVIIPSFFFLWSKHRDLDLLLIGDDLAQSKGLDVQRLRIVCFVLVSVMVGGLVSLVGPIGFVGLVIPHMIRLFVGFRHRTLIWMSFLLGGLVLSGCDALGRILVKPQEIPVGVITAVLGSPILFILLMRQKRPQ